MTEKLYSPEQFNQALDDAGVECNAMQWKKINESLTRPQPEFREGQVVSYITPHGFQTYGEYRPGDPNNTDQWNCRPLTPEEVGPGYVPVEDVRPLVEVLTRIAGNSYDSGAIATRIDSECLANCRIDAQDALDVLPDNLKELIDE